MIWLSVIALAIWCFVQQGQIATLKERVTRAASEGGSEEDSAAPDTLEQPPGPRRAHAPQAFPVNPLSEQSPAPAIRVLESASSGPNIVPLHAEAEALVEPSRPLSRNAIEWLSEHGLAWLGGGVLALGGLLLVSYATHRGLFSPAVRIWAAVALGVAALVCGEILHRRKAGAGDTERLVAALVTGAGAATLYGATWAAYGLYGYIPAPAAIVLLSTISFGLLALSFRHNQALGVLAVAFAFAAPLVASVGQWSGPGQTGFVLLILLTGAAAAGLRRWPFVAAATLAGALAWALLKESQTNFIGMGVLAGAAAVAITAAAAWPARSSRSQAPTSLMSSLPTVAIILASVLSLAAWFHEPEAPALIGPLLIAVCALSAMAGAAFKSAPPWSLAAPASALVLCATGVAFGLGQGADPSLAGLLVGAAVVALAGLGAGRRGVGTVAGVAIGAAAAALTLTLCVGTLRAHAPMLRILADLIAAAGFGSGAWVLKSRSADPTRDAALAAWLGAGVEAVGLVVHALTPPEWAPLGYALLSAALGALSLRLNWRGVVETCAIAALAAFAALLGPSSGGAVLASAGAGDWSLVAIVGSAAALAQVAAWALLKRRSQGGGAAEAVSTLAILTGLLTAFLALRGLGAPTGTPGGGLHTFAEASLRTVLLLVAGLTLVLRGAATRFGRLRGPALLAVGTLHGLLLEGLVQHPWWGLHDPVAGPPIIDDLLLGLLAPAAILTVAARRGAAASLRSVFGAAAVSFTLLWLVTEVRRLFHGPYLALGALGYAEAAAYAAILVGAAAFLVWLGARRNVSAPVSKNLVIKGAAWTGAGAGFMLLVFVASPWWGPLAGDLPTPGLLAAGYLAALGFGGVLVAQSQRRGWRTLAEAGLVGWLLELFVALTLLIRFAFHGAAMRAPLKEAGLETWTFSAAWAVYGLAVLALGAKRRDVTMRWTGLGLLLVTTLKVFLFDLARLDGVIRAASFLALGVVLLVAALAARRLNGARNPTSI